MSGFDKRWMMFVDGENLTIRAQEIAGQQGVDLNDRQAFPVYLKDVYFWPAGSLPWDHNWVRRPYAQMRAERCYFYTCAFGDDIKLDAAHDELQKIGFNPIVISKRKGQRAKGVDISLTKDMLLQAFLDNYDIAVLVAGDGDYVPLVDEVKRLGKYVVVAFFDPSGLNPALKRAADEFYPLRLQF
jgi:uncharacterized LabA/DUF88 family protein